MTRKLEKFEPLKPGKVGMYACGVTVYDRCHLGHARAMVSFDIIQRFLRFSGYEVTFVRNITDIDDKIIARAISRGISIDELTSEQIAFMHEDAKALNLLPPDIEPRATTHVDAIIHLIERLIEKDIAYISNDGDVCFEVARFKEYGKLSNRNPDDLVAGARVNIAEGKRSPLDFVLWKRAKSGEPSWSSPWGEGRPGWHIECSAMAMTELGETFDIHGGGLDLKFPHHENEIAQSEAATHQCFARYWLHVGLLQVNNEKMAKSTGNFFTIESVLKDHHPEALRYFLMSSHYRSPLGFSDNALMNAHKALTRLYQSLTDVNIPDGLEIDEHWKERFLAAMNDDINTPLALSVLFDLSHELNKTKDAQLAVTLKSLASVLGLLQENPASFLQSNLSKNTLDIESLILERNLAKQHKNWEKADTIRQTLLEAGIELQDGPSGTTWRSTFKKG